MFFPQFFIETLVGAALRAMRNSRRFYGELHFKSRLSVAISHKPRNCKSCSKRDFNEFVLRVDSTFQRDEILKKFRGSEKKVSRGCFQVSPWKFFNF
jgi:hypothetical protein